ncbi:GlxA family transcriptional regulator [Marinobacter nanhaiticus D15-8W]|uniref:GlxA family transcriptional regulator n=1 Tax=Marinobacter nanhaiticus D15-8W TaxID=626887 RepID=N6VV14_9GAMM|nr:GlxA family transcriptional regulator [Marinobacter nanhaiticus]ENO14020.1 GlxA family transcriptional regulator [Marinobacter nanhaiticus D15-8W]BES71398.1 GlxA family transcriptional regulator [Marinobacter nanhaiticus D15-8W]
MRESTVSRERAVGTEPYRVGFLLINNFTLVALASAIDPLRMANQLTSSELYTWQLLSRDGEAVKASDGIAISPDGSIDDKGSFDIVIVVGGVDITRSFGAKEVHWLQTQAHRKVLLGAICTGAYVLASGGLLDGYQCSVHWECLASLQERFPRVKCSNHLYTLDRDRMTCTGGSVPMDMMLSMITRQHGKALTNAVCDMFVCDRVRPDNELQRTPLRRLLVTSQPKLAEVTELMEANLEEPIELEELASFVGISRRQLERLFLKHLNCTPSRYYLKLRLDRARQLLKQTTCSIIEVASMCGFVSAPHFSRCYRKYVGISPKEERTAVWSFKRMESHSDSTLVALPTSSNVALQIARAEPSYGSVNFMFDQQSTIQELAASG